jgi:hypothetical protein
VAKDIARRGTTSKQPSDPEEAATDPLPFAFREERAAFCILFIAGFESTPTRDYDDALAYIGFLL